MTRHSSITLSDHDAEFIDAQVDNGAYRSAAEVVSAGLRLLEEHEAKVKALQAALDDGLNSGPATPFDADEFFKRMHEKYVDRS